MTAALKELLARVEAATGPDGALDTALLAHCYKARLVTIPDKHAGDWQALQNDAGDLVAWAPLTASIDAALALVERLLPGWTIAHLTQQDDKSWFCELREGYLTSYNRVAMSETMPGKRPANLPLAILAALLKAKLAETPE